MSTLTPERYEAWIGRYRTGTIPVVAPDTVRSDAVTMLVVIDELSDEASRLRQRVASLEHDALAEQPPTQWAYDRACAALEKHRNRADALAEALGLLVDSAEKLKTAAADALGVDIAARAARPTLSEASQ